MNKRAVRLCVCLIALALTWPARGTEESQYRVQGVFTDSETDDPIRGVVVQVITIGVRDPRLLSHQGTSDEKGRFSIALPVGHAEFGRITPPAGYRRPKHTAPRVFATTNDSPIVTRDFKLQKDDPEAKRAAPPPMLAKVKKTIRGRVVDGGGAPVPNAQVCLNRGGMMGGDDSAAVTDAAGEFELINDSIHPGLKVWFTVVCDGFAMEDVRPPSVEFDKAGKADIGQIALSVESSIVFRVLDIKGIPAHGAVVYPERPTGQFKLASRTNEKGECVINRLQPGRPFFALVDYGGYIGRSETVDLGPGRNTTQIIRLEQRPKEN